MHEYIRTLDTSYLNFLPLLHILYFLFWKLNPPNKIQNNLDVSRKQF